MRVYRLSRTEYARDLRGEGARLFGGRWNSPGIPLLYTAISRALAFAEVAVHIDPGLPETEYSMIEISVPPKGPIGKVNESSLPDGWNRVPHGAAAQYIGNRMVRDGALLGLRVPSVVVPGDENLLLNPAHPHFKQVKVTAILPFPLDKRLFRI